MNYTVILLGVMTLISGVAHATTCIQNEILESKITKICFLRNQTLQLINKNGTSSEYQLTDSSMIGRTTYNGVPFYNLIEAKFSSLSNQKMLKANFYYDYSEEEGESFLITGPGFHLNVYSPRTVKIISDFIN